MSNELKMGVTSESNSRGSFVKTSWFKIPANSTVVYRILPPLHSLAERGVYAKYHSIHYGFKDSKGHVRPFTCIEEKNKDKFVTKRCPVCDMVSEMEGKLKVLQSQGHSQENLKTFRENNISPFKAVKKYYMNAIDGNGEIGILPLGYKAFQDLERVRKEQKDKGMDLTGIKGSYIEISRTGFALTTEYRVSLHQESVEVNGETFSKVKRHELTPDIIQAMKTKTRDLADLFRTIDEESVAALVSTSGIDRAALVDVVFGTPEKTRGNSETGLSSTDLGLGVEAVGRVTLDKGDITLEKPFLSDIKRSETFSMNDSRGNVIAETVSREMAKAVNERQPAPQAKPVSQKNTMSDDEFFKTFGKVTK